MYALSQGRKSRKGVLKTLFLALFVTGGVF
jgi:hypothetical protein